MANVDKFYRLNISDKEGLKKVFDAHNFDVIFHLGSILSTGGEKNPKPKKTGLEAKIYF